MQGEPQTHRDGNELSHRPAIVERPVALGVLACAFVGTAHWLGTTWVAEPFLSLPLGMWVVGGVIGASYWRQRRSAGTTVQTRLPEFAERIRGAMNVNVGNTLRRIVSHPIYSSNQPSERREDRSEQRTERAARVSRSDSVLRIGVGGPDEFVEAFLAQIQDEGQTEARYEQLTSPVREPEDCARRNLAGAVTFTSSGQASIVLPEIRGREAGWDDWSHRLALSYPAVFPARIDAARIACGPVRAREPRESRLVARLAEAAALLAQSESRTGSRRSAEWVANHRERTERAMAALARTFSADWSDENDRPITSPVCRAAARGVGAWLCMWDGDIDPQERRQWISHCSTFLPDEPEAHLRLAAAQIGAYEDDQALPALRRAFELLRSSGELPLSDPLAFVLAEMELGNFSSLALGRVASGLAIAWATAPKESVAYLRDDLIDDLQHSGKLVGRDQDHAFLKRVMAHMDRLRSDTLPMRSRSAA
jgi:hypothetical protein